MNEINALNKTAAFHIYADLCEVQNYAYVKACLLKESNYVYFEAQRSQTNIESSNFEIILPLDEIQNEFSFTRLSSIIDEIENRKKFKLGIVSTDFTTVYYDCTLGIECPFEKEHYLKVNQFQ